MNLDSENVLFNLYMHMKFLDLILYDIEAKKDMDVIT